MTAPTPVSAPADHAPTGAAPGEPAPGVPAAGGDGGAGVSRGRPAAVPSAVRATARVRTAPDGRGGTAVPVLDGDGPLAPRRVRSSGPGACVCLVGAMSAPLNGDRIRLEVTVAPGTALRLTTAAATVALPGRSTAPATYDVVLRVGEGAGLHWLPEPLISARGSDLRMTTRVELDPTARLVLREEQVLGRAAEEPGRLSCRLTVRRGGRPLLDQETSCGPGAPGWDGPAVLGGNRATGQLLTVDPAFAEQPPQARLYGDGPDTGEAVRTPLAGPAALVMAIAPDALRVRRLLTAASVLSGA